MEELRSSVGRLDGEVKELSHRERLLVAFPELAPTHQTQPQSKALLFIVIIIQLLHNCFTTKNVICVYLFMICLVTDAEINMQQRKCLLLNSF